MIIAGWADGYTNNSLRTFEQLRCPKRVIVGPWAHQATDTSRPGPNVDILPEQLKWWDRWLKGIDNGVDREPPIVVFARRSTKPEPDLDADAGRMALRADVAGRAAGRAAAGTREGLRRTVRRRSRHPRGRARRRRLDRRGSPAPETSRTVSRRTSGPTRSGRSCTTGRRSRTSSTSSGYPFLDVTVTSSAPVAYLSAKLCDAFADGTSAARLARHAEPRAPRLARGSVAARARRADARFGSRSRSPRGPSTPGTGSGWTWPARTGRTRGRRPSRWRSRSTGHRRC